MTTAAPRSSERKKKWKSILWLCTSAELKQHVNNKIAWPTNKHWEREFTIENYILSTNSLSFKLKIENQKQMESLYLKCYYLVISIIYLLYYDWE